MAEDRTVTYISRYEYDKRPILIIDGRRIRAPRFDIDMGVAWLQSSDDVVFKPQRRRLDSTITWTDSNGDHKVRARIAGLHFRPSGRAILIYSTQEG